MSDDSKKPDCLKIINAYETMDKKYLAEKPVFKNQKHLKVKFPSRILICGTSGSCKTSTVKNIIRCYSCFEKIYLFAKDLNEPIYHELTDICKAVEAEIGENILFESDDIDDLPPLTDIDANKNNLCIVDDMIAEKKAKLKNMAAMWIRGRRKNVSTLFLTQKFTETPLLIRSNTTYYIFKRMSDDDETRRIFRRWAGPKTVDEMFNMYKKITTASIDDFFMVDIEPPSPEYRYRKNFEPAWPKESYKTQS
jgi:hypothetical protein